MIEPISTAAAMTIAKIAFDKFIEGGAGELGKKVTEGMTNKIQQLAQAVLSRLKGNAEAIKVLQAAEQGSVEDTQKLTNYLDALWEKNPEFSKQVQQLAKEIHLELTRNDIQAENVQQIYDNAQGVQINGENKQPVIQIQGNPTLHFGREKQD
jgi:hypothetical protein